MNIETLTPKECSTLLTELKTYQGTPHQKAQGLRNWFAALIMLEAGLRVGELVKLRQSALWFGNQPTSNLVITPEIAKRKQERHIPISQTLHEAIIDLEEHYWTPGGYVPTAYAIYQTDNSKNLTTRTLERIIRSAALLSIRRPIHPHALRHTFATRLMQVTNSSVVQELLGHKHLSSTQVYCHPNSADLQSAITLASAANVAAQAQ